MHFDHSALVSWRAKTGASLAVIGKSPNHKPTQTTAINARLGIPPFLDSMNTATHAMLKTGGMGKNDVAEDHGNRIMCYHLMAQNIQRINHGNLQHTRIT